MIPGELPQNFPVTPSGIENVTFRLVAIVAIIFNVLTSKMSVFKYFGLWGTLVLKIYVSRNLLLYIHSFVFNTDIDVKLLFKL